ncbi:MAG: M23 family metallopeptidase [Sphaerospermopsis kisseleviana]
MSESGCPGFEDFAAADIEAVLAHAPFDSFFSCSEHFAGQFKFVGDALGTDCVVQKLTEVNGLFFSRAFTSDGSRNEDWYGWNMPIQAPCDCIVTSVSINSVTNSPGKVGKPPASIVEFRREDGVHFLYAHIQDPSVKVGETVRAGQAFAKVGNNGYGRIPHVHVGAWRDKEPLQVRWDQRTMRLPPELRQSQD